MGEQINIKVPLDQLKDRVCTCGGKVFSNALSLKEIPPLYSPSGKLETAMVPIGFICVGCGALMSVRPEGPVVPEKSNLIILDGGNKQ